MIKTFFLFLGLSLLCSCSNEKRQKDLDHCPIVATYEETNGIPVLVCDFSAIKDTIRLPLSYLVRNLEIIPLDTCSEALNKPEATVSVSEHYISLANYDTPIQLFDRKTGKYIRQIGNVGQGPEEYFSASNVQIDEVNQSILTHSSGYILRYGMTGEYINRYPLAYSPRSTLIYTDLNTNKITVLRALTQDMQKQNTPYIWVQSLEGKVEQSLDGSRLGIHNMPEPNGYIHADENSFYVFDRDCFKNDSLYRYDIIQNRLDPKFTIKWKDDIPSHIIKELPNHYCCVFGDLSKWQQLILVDKKTKKGAFVKLVIDQLDENILWTDLFRSYKLGGYKGFQLLVDPLDLCDKIKDPSKKIGGKLMESNLLQSENSWVFIGEWK